MNLETWLLYCATEVVLCFTPGLAVLLVISTALTSGVRDGLRASLGILAANALYFALSATSLGALLAATPAVFTVVKWLGAAYLVVTGAQAIYLALARSAPPATPSAGAPLAAPRGRPLLRGFATQAANPKALLFFIAILPQFIDPRGDLVLQAAVLGGSGIAIEFLVLAFYAAAAARARGFVQGARGTAALDALGGALLVFAGVGLAVLRP